MASYFFQMIAVLPVTIALLIIFRPPVEMVTGYVIGAIVAGFFSSNIGLLIDILRPKLNWNSPQEAIKQNMNILFFVFGTIAYIALLGFGIMKLFEWKIVNFDSLIYVAAGLAVIHIILGFVILFLDIKMFEKRLKEFSVD